MQQPAAAAGRHAPEARERRLSLRACLAWTAAGCAAVGVVMVAAWGDYTPGDDVGYNLGLAGGLAMLALFGYPLRKRVRWMGRAGPVKHWFALHMALGLAGPALILAHSRLTLASLNATIAFWSMVLVASSGVVGRFLYRQVHHGLDGRRESLDALRARAGMEGEEVRTWLRFLPAVREVLERFDAEAQRAAPRSVSGWLAFACLAPRARAARRRARTALASELPVVAQARGWESAVLARRMAKGEALIESWIAHAQAIGRLSAYERLFALWHVVHLPFVVLLVASAAVHVLYVHMY